LADVRVHRPDLLRILLKVVLDLQFQILWQPQVEIETTFDSTSFLVNDSIYVDASCSENVEEYLWELAEGLSMLGNGTSASESFIIQPLPGALARSINLTVSNAKSSRNHAEFVIVFSLYS